MNKDWRNQVVIPVARHLALGAADVIVALMKSAGTKIANGEYHLPKRFHNVTSHNQHKTIIDAKSYVVHNSKEVR